tara:strand:- start:869 stop:1468 length:600 start_codon:yes stop_codon:yes gene_type:complete
MKKLVLVVFFMTLSPNLCSQINYYVGLDLLTTRARVAENGAIKTQTNFNYAAYIGNEILLNNNISLFVDVTYQNNKNIMKELPEQDTRFELHQTLSLLIKPCFNIQDHRIGPILGISGVYVFDKKEATGAQVDRFDEGYILGMNYNNYLSEKTSFNISVLANFFESISHYTSSKLLRYSTICFGAQYNLFGSNKRGGLK